MKEIEKVKAGFWIRFAAVIIDTLLIYIVTYIIVKITQLFILYIPFELTFLILAILYSTISLGIRKGTLGKLLCGLLVLQKGEIQIGFIRSILREFVGKFIIGLLLPFLITWFIVKNLIKQESSVILVSFLAVVITLVLLLIQYLITKRTWYDYIANTLVEKNKAYRNKYIISVTIIFCFALLVSGLSGPINDYRIYQDYSQYSLAKPPYFNRNATDLIDVSSLDSTKYQKYVNWINQNAEPAMDYAVEKASEHQVTFFGEIHEQSDLLKFLQDMIPELYYKAGVRCIAIEVCTHEDNALINKLVTSEKYDSALALDIGRHQPWLAWGFKDYWDVFKAVWKLNRSLPTGKDKMEVIGIDSKWDGPSFALGNGKGSPFYERLRIFRALESLVNMQFRDELMAKEIEEQIINKNKKGIVWIGSYHSFINYKQPFSQRGRTAYILHQKYGDKIYQIFLHQDYFSAKIVDPNYSVGLDETKFGNFIESIISHSNYKQIGFDLGNSPFDNLRDSTVYFFHYQPNVRFADLTEGYIYLKPNKSYIHCSWARDFITPQMFAKEKPYYELMTGRKFTSAKEVNEFYSNNN
jgi:uncharacterized RDD family membrane protein YckC